MALYNQIKPLKILLDKITIRKIVLLQRDRDITSDQENINRLKSQIKGNN